jgi:hypothetical protein
VQMRFIVGQIAGRWLWRRARAQLWGRTLALALCVVLLGGCFARPLGHATPTPGPHAPAGPDLFVASAPAVEISPTKGGADTEVMVDARGFPADWRLFIYVAPYGAGNPRNSYGEGTSDKDGRVKMTFPMPATWSDGRPITETKLLVIVATQDLYSRAQAEFEYVVEK